MLKELQFEFKLVSPILWRLLLLVLSSFGGSIVAIITTLAVVFYDLSKGNIRLVFIVFVAILLFSDSNSRLFYESGKGAKDLSLVLITLYLVLSGKVYLQFSYTKYFALYILVALVGLLITNFSFLGLQKLISYSLIIWVIPVMLYLIFNKGEGLIFFKQIIMTFAVLYLISIVLSRLLPASFAQFGRFNGIHRNPNGVGIFSTLFIMNLFLIRDKVKTIFSNKLFYAIVILFLITIVLSGSRTAFLSLGIFFIFNLFRIKFVFGFILVSILAFSYGFIMYQIESVIIAANLQNELRLDTLSYASGRIYIWQACWMEIQNNYWLGHGFSYEEYSKWDKAYYKILPMLIHNYGNIHNSYLTIWLNTGLLGLLAYLAGIITYTIKNQFKSKLLSPFMFAAMFMAFFESYMVASLNPYTWQLWFAFFIVTVSFKPSVINDKIPKEGAMAKEVSSVN